MLIQMWNSDSKPENESKKENENENEERTGKITHIHIHEKGGGERRDVEKVEEDDEEDRERVGRRLRRRRRSRTSLPHWLSFFWLLSSICLSCGNSLQIQTQSPPIAAFTTKNIISLSSETETETENQSLDSSLSSFSPQTFTGESQSESQNYNSATTLSTVLKLPGETITVHNDQLPENNQIQESGSESESGEDDHHSSSVPSNANPTKFSTHATTLTTIKDSLKSATTTTIITSAKTATTTTTKPENSKTSISPQHHLFSPVKAPSIKLEKNEGENEKVINISSNNDRVETYPLAEKLPLPHVKKQAPSNMGMLRNMWSSTRTGKLNMNLTQEHESILRVETQKERDGNKNKPVEFLSPATTTGHAPQIQSLSLSHSQNEIGEIPELKTKTTFLSTNDHFHDREEGKLVNKNEEKLKYKSAILYPEWLSSSGGVYPDDNNNFTGDYYTDQAAYEHEHDHDASQGQEKFPGTPEQKTKLDREEMAGERDISSPRKNLRKRINDEILARIINKTTPAVSVGVDAGSGSSSHVMIGSSSSSLDSPGLSILKSSHSHQSSRAGLVNLKISPSNIDSRGESRGESQSESQNLNSQIQSVESNTANNLKLFQELQENGAGSFESSASNGLVTSVGSSSSSSSSSNAVQPGLADVISRGRIDSVMYVYFGDKYNDYHKEEVAGRVIQAVGGVVAAIAQVLTVLGAAKCVRRVTHSQSLPVHLHIGFALLLSNLLLLLAVHATEPLDVCASVALILHYLHLVIGCWLFAHTLQTYRALCRHVSAPTLLSPDQDPSSDSSHIQSFRMVKPSTIRYSIAAWTAPVPFLIMSYILNPNGYETHRYCWMSIEKGMVISFIVPIFFLIGLNTFLVVLSLRHLLALRKLWEDGSLVGEVDEDTLDGKIISSGIRASAMLLPLLAIMWFLGVVALENSTSIFFQLAATLANIALSWLVLYFLGEDVWPESWCHLAKLDRVRRDSSLYEDALNSSVQPSSAQLSFDNEPLLTAAAPVPSTSSQLLSSSSSAAVAAALAAATSYPRHSTSSSSSSSGNNGYASSSHKIATPSTLLPGPGLVHVSLNGCGSVGVSGGINNNSGSATGTGPGTGASTSTASMNGGAGAGGGGGKHHPNPAALSHPHPSTSSSTSATTSSRWPKNNRPNWSRPGGNEIYELRHDAISTIYK